MDEVLRKSTIAWWVSFNVAEPVAKIEEKNV